MSYKVPPPEWICGGSSDMAELPARTETASAGESNGTSSGFAMQAEKKNNFLKITNVYLK